MQAGLLRRIPDQVDGVHQHKHLGEGFRQVLRDRLPHLHEAMVQYTGTSLLLSVMSVVIA